MVKIRFWPKIRIRHSVPRAIFKILLNESFFDHLRVRLFCFHTFGVRRSIDILDPENQSGSGPIGLTEEV